MRKTHQFYGNLCMFFSPLGLLFANSQLVVVVQCIFFYPPWYGPAKPCLHRHFDERSTWFKVLLWRGRMPLLIHLTTRAGELKLQYLTCYTDIGKKGGTWFHEICIKHPCLSKCLKISPNYVPPFWPTSLL